MVTVFNTLKLLNILKRGATQIAPISHRRNGNYLRWHNRGNVLFRNFATVSAAQQNVPPPSTTEKNKEKPRGEPVTVTFVRATDGQKYTVKGREGDSLLDVVIDKQVPLDGYGACEGTLACSTCHVVLSKSDYDKLPDTPSDEELDMLDLAYGLTDTSRLGCQICLSKALEGLEITVPSGTYDARST